MDHYIYEGPVMGISRLMTSKWRGETYAISEKKAISNLSSQFKKQYGLLQSSKITLTGKPIKDQRASYTTTIMRNK